MAELAEPRKSPRSKDAESLHYCPHCDRVYERSDHLTRHLDSHQNKRTFQCNVCGRGFNRRDVLQRHGLLHIEGRPNTKRRGRVIQACEECAASKVSCDHNRPCTRCRRKGFACAPRKPRQSTNKALFTPATEHGTPDTQMQGDCVEETQITPSSTEPFVADYNMPLQPQAAFADRDGAYSLSNPPIPQAIPLTEGLSPRHRDQPPENHMGIYREANGIPAFFEQVMLPPDTSPWPGFQGVQQPRGIFDFMCEPDFTSPDGGLFNFDTINDLDIILGSGASPVTANLNPGVPIDDQSAKQRVAAFRRSLWLWIPEKNQNGFSGEGHIPLEDGDMTAFITRLHRSRLESLNIRGKLTVQSRDNIFRLIISTARSQLSVPSFPSAESLDALIKIGISKRTETDAWIHPYTLFRQDSRPELLAALVAAGCVCCGISSINKTGVLLLEILRVSLAQLAELDNSVLRDLQYFQASMMWLDIGIFCGHKRKMQIAESHLQPLCTALRRAGAFDRSFYSQFTSYPDLNDDMLEETWNDWIRQESWKRLAYHLFEHDTEVTAAMNRPPLTSYTEFTLPFPSSRELWLAPTAAAWKHLLVTNYAHLKPPTLSLRDLLADPSMLNHLPLNVDTVVCKSSLLHGLMSQVWEFRQQALLIPKPHSERGALTQLWLKSRQEDLSISIQAAKLDMINRPAIATLLAEFAAMYLHINLDSIQRFAGQFGELEAREEYPRLRDWSITREARTAIWHAGQVIRAAREVPPFELRGFEILCIYHATLVLWIFGLLQCVGKPRDALNLPPGSSSSGGGGGQQTEPLIALDGLESEFTKAFVDGAVGQPGLTYYSASPEGGHGSMSIQLCSPHLIMDVARQVLEGNCQGSGDNLPPLVGNICNLIRELGDLS